MLYLSSFIQFYLYQKVTQNIMRMCAGNQTNFEDKFRSEEDIDVNNCLYQIELPIVYASYSEILYVQEVVTHFI